MLTFPLSKLKKLEDSVIKNAESLIRRAMREIRGEIADLGDSLNIAGSAAEREKVYEFIRRKYRQLASALDSLMRSANTTAAKAAAIDAGELTGLEVKYSAQRAEAICELVTPAQGRNLAAVFTDAMSANLINSLRNATVAVIRTQALAGGSLKQQSKELESRWRSLAKKEPEFVDKGGSTWDIPRYLQMNIRTNTMRVYNDCLADDCARVLGHDLMKVSSNGSDPHCVCACWEGCIVSTTGKNKDFPSYEAIRRAGVFHPNCVHQLMPVIEAVDADEIAMQKDHPLKLVDREHQEARQLELDKIRAQRTGLSPKQAEVKVARDRLERSIRHGLIRSDAREIVDKLTDAQVTALCKDGNPPRFTPTKKATKKDPHAADEKFIHGKRGGVVHISRNATVADLLKVTGVQDAKTPEPAKTEEPKWTPQTDLEKKTDALMRSIGVEHTDKPLGIEGVNPKYATHDFHYTNNCGRCCDAYEVRSRGYEVIAKGTSGNRRLSPVGDWMQCGNALGGGGWCEMYAGNNFGILFGNSKQKIERKMAKWGNGARAKVFVQWKGGGGHFFVAEQINGSTVFKCPQSGKIYDDTVWNVVKNSRFNAFLRTDNLELNDKIFECIEKP